MEPVLSFNNWISFEDRIRDLPIYQLFSDFRRYDIKDISQKLFTQASSTLLDFSRNITFSSAQICGQYDNSRLALKSWVSLVRPISFLINFCKALGFTLPPEGALCSPKDSIALSTKHSVTKVNFWTPSLKWTFEPQVYNELLNPNSKMNYWTPSQKWTFEPWTFEPQAINELLNPKSIMNFWTPSQKWIFEPWTFEPEAEFELLNPKSKMKFPTQN